MLTKILLTVLVIVVVLFGYRAFGRVTSMIGAADRDSAAGDAPKGRLRTENMTKCGACGVYVAATDPRRCDRSDCPYPP